MIGVISKNEEIEIVKEFFELFKTPWEFYQHNRSYDVIISTEREIWEVDSELLIIFGSDNTLLDSKEGIFTTPEQNNSFIRYENIEIPIYGEISSLNGPGRPFIRSRRSSIVIGLEIHKSNKKLLRLGYNLFQEISYLLTIGQPAELAFIPTLECHISMLRSWILGAGIPLVEIPPIPSGYDFTACLTHDVDFVRIRDHRFDYTMWGFVFRATIGSLLNVLRGKIPLSSLSRNWIAVLSLPLIYLGICRDIWLQFDQYLKIERNVPSTFFLIPFKNRTGDKVSSPISKRRATKYDITDVQKEVRNLLSRGCEVGVHGIDAWHNVDLGRKELDRIYQVTSQSNIGIRIHWLCFNDQSPRILDKAGFSYDSTFGYNDVVGYRGGTLQVFQPLGTQRILELPLHIQDTALLFPKRMNLSRNEALNVCKELIKTNSAYGGILTVLWHLRSLAPERLYKDSYINLLKELKSLNVWFATGEQVIQWFRKRRDFNFGDIQCCNDTIKIEYSSCGTDTLPPLMLRIHQRKPKNNDLSYSIHTETSCIDLHLTGDIDEHFSFNAHGF